MRVPKIGIRLMTIAMRVPKIALKFVMIAVFLCADIIAEDCSAFIEDCILFDEDWN